MILMDSMWALPVNVLSIVCEECNVGFIHPTNYSLVRCPRCGIAELWHEVAPRPSSGPWSEPIMERRK